jgi:hypothetical protein
VHFVQNNRNQQKKHGFSEKFNKVGESREKGLNFAGKLGKIKKAWECCFFPII